MAQPQPYSGLWDESNPNVIRWDPQIYFWEATVLQSFYVIWDFTFFVFPAKILWGLNMRPHQKVGVMLLMASLLVVMAAAISKMNDLCFSTCVEQALVITMGCVPMLRSITKLSLPSMSGISGSLTNLVTKVRKMAPCEKIGSSFQGHERSSIESLELSSRFDISNNSGALAKAKITASLSDSDGDMPTHHGLRRTDSFTVTYHDQARPVQDPFIADFIGKGGETQVGKLSVGDTKDDTLVAYAAYESGKPARIALLSLDLWTSQNETRPQFQVPHLSASIGALAEDGLTYAELQWTLESNGKENRVKNDSNMTVRVNAI
ncbi:hypothetical protein F4819DRAFT_492311 [Hypoxylon fuscum]|nr:hypothetical protein F4819DRAFT_492311 [Hypoxylon fuscum]